MMSEVTRGVFLNLLRDYSPKHPGWVAVCVFIPPEVVHNRCAGSAQELIDKALLALKETTCSGMFARIGWTVFFVLAEGDCRQLRQTVETIACVEDEAVRWHTAMRPIGLDSTNLDRLFSSLEVDAHEAARSNFRLGWGFQAK